ncbi:Transcription factor GRAS [Dillenia turbinata]|uniref:Transcription factor GRAS n=1 Tax=Dillenia turbinata TaxID=194707 RepID=A0AAN8W551_9MAGN
MMQSELLQASWPFYDMADSMKDQVEGPYGFGIENQVGDYEFSPSFTISEDSSLSCSISHLSKLLSGEFIQSPDSGSDLQVELQMEGFTSNLEGFERILSCEFDKLREWMEMEESEESIPSLQPSSNTREDDWSPCPLLKSGEESMEYVSSALKLPGKDMEIDNQEGILHLLEAYGEAIEMGQRELAEVILKCINEKSNPIGEPVERLAFNLFQSPDNKQGEYLKQEATKNFPAAFKAFYQSLPFGKFAHYAANATILESMPDDIEVVHIIDFDLGEGIQWPSVIEAIAQEGKALKLTLIKWTEDDQGSLEETKRRLFHYATSLGLLLKMEDIRIEDLVSEVKRMKKRSRPREYLVFNCMTGLPHMARLRSKRHIFEFLMVAKDLISNSTRGIIAVGDGDAGESLKNCCGYGSFFNGYLAHYRAMYEAVEMSLPAHLAEAKLAMECLFLSPFVSSHGWAQNWEEMNEGCDFRATIGLQGWRLSRQNLIEARELVKDVRGSYRVRIEGQNENEMVLDWQGTPVVRVSIWK